MLIRYIFFIIVLPFLSDIQYLLCSTSEIGPREVTSLNGEWQVAQGSFASVPETFDHIVVVPGLLDMAEPAFIDIGKKSSLRQAFWYRKVFKVNGPVSDFAILKIHKAKYGTKVYLNGQFVGEHWPCFTPGYFNLKNYILDNSRENELIIGVGANRESVPEGRPTGWDFEKYLYIPGIYDRVELILTGTPHIKNVQLIPQIENSTIRVVTELESDKNTWQGKLHYSVTEKISGKQAGADSSSLIHLGASQIKIISKTIAIENCRLWSPENPFLYQIEVNTEQDAVTIPFGMRSFRFDRKSGFALLNGKPFMMRGTNVCIYRFFEDSLRNDKPWRTEWVERLHKKFKSMHWNSIRYCIGFPPEEWYDIADRLGFLIQDEFPIWLLSRAPENPQSQYIIEEYTEWMRERWNHPCVVIWDAQNESVTKETGKVVQSVRHLDLSNRPWENGWEAPQSPNDVVESHPYLFIRGFQSGKDFFQFKDIASISGNPRLRAEQQRYDVPVIVNEYAWLWLNRDGSTTTLTKNLYNHLFGENSTSEERFFLYARYLAALTEFWRSHRQCAGVLHFCGLGYARSGLLPRPEGGATSDHFIDLETLTFEPNFEKYVRDAFSPVGLMIDFWHEEVEAEAIHNLDVAIINDLYREWQGQLSLSIKQGENTIAEQSQHCILPALKRKVLSFSFKFPSNRGVYDLIAEIDLGGEKVRSIRRFTVQ